MTPTDRSLLVDLTTRSSTGPDLQHEIEQFLYREARLLDDGRTVEWLALIADDIEYVVVPAGNRSADSPEPASDDGAVLEEDRASLTGRVKRLESGMAWAEEPRSRTRRLVTNIEVSADEAGGYLVGANLLLFRSRLETTEHLLTARRVDLLRRVLDGGFEIARRHVRLDHCVLMTSNLSMFF